MFHMHHVCKHVYKHTQQHPENRVAYLFVMLNVACSAVNPCREQTHTHTHINSLVFIVYESQMFFFCCSLN